MPNYLSAKSSIYYYLRCPLTSPWNICFHLPLTWEYFWLTFYAGSSSPSYVLKAPSFVKSATRSFILFSTACTERFPFNLSNSPFTFRSSTICLEDSYCVISRWRILLLFLNIAESSTMYPTIGHDIIKEIHKWQFLLKILNY